MPVGMERSRFLSYEVKERDGAVVMGRRGKGAKGSR